MAVRKTGKSRPKKKTARTKARRSAKSVTRKRHSPPLPVVSEQQVLENDARPLLEQSMRPWLVTQCTTHDYGMDAVAEVLTRRDGDGGDYYDTGRRIGIQLKATSTAETDHVAVSVHVRSVRYWLASHEPFMVVVCHVPTRRLAYRWVDHDLLAELAARDLAWFTRESVTIRVAWASALTPDVLGQLDREARLVVVRRYRVLTPGTYDQLLTDTKKAMSAVVHCAEQAGFASVVDQLKEAEERVRKATYIVALAGRMRAGKSTLFNALARREVSPVGRRPTTAVPLFVAAGAVENARVTFRDGKTEDVSPTAKALAKYATQEENPDNELGVQLITVSLVSERLERGISLLDAPGLFDPSQHIREITARALAAANVVLFVMDVSSARTGGFAVEAHTIAELESVLDHSERVFLLLNKADELADADRLDVTATLDRALARKNLSDRLAGSPAFVSARQAWEWVAAGAAGDSPLAALEADIWDYLLATNSTGINRLEDAVRGSLVAIADSLGFIAMRCATSEKARSVQESLALAERDISQLKAGCGRAREAARWRARATLAFLLRGIPAAMAEEMRAARAVPGKQVIADRLVARLSPVFDSVWLAEMRELKQHAQKTSEQLEVVLRQVSLEHEPSPMPVLLAPSFQLPTVDTFAPEAWGFGALGGIIVWLVNPGYAAVAAIGSFIVGAWLGEDGKRERQIAQIEQTLSRHVEDSLGKPAEDLLTALAAGYDRLDRHVEDRWSVFEKDARDQLEAAGRALSQEEKEQAARLEVELTATKRVLEAVAEEIRWTPASE